ncbi:MAG TPA: hypothetical protein VF062_19825 [Candidatus Limnocylindrales bacterium]
MLRRAGVSLLALVLGTGVGATVLTGPAMAGGWAATVIDPAGTIEPGKAHQVSFWVLQHGTHPYNRSDPASIGIVGLMLTDDRGSRVTFTGKELPEPAHFVTTVTVPYAGKWKVTGIQGVFASFHVGALTVPGTLQPLGVPAAPSAQDLQKYWPGKVQPPVMEVDHKREPYAADDSFKPDVIAAQAPANAPAGGNDTGTGGAAANRSDWRMPTLAGGLVVLLLAALAFGGRRWWVRRGVPQT